MIGKEFCVSPAYSHLSIHTQEDIMKRALLLTFLMLFMVACSSSEPIVEVREVEVTKLVTEIVKETVPVVETQLVTVEITKIVTPTETPGPSPTPTLTLTPTITPTLTPTPTPFNVSRCEKLELPIPKTDNANPWKDSLPNFDGKCVQLIYEPFIKSDKGVVGFDYLLSFNVDFVIDYDTPEGVTKPKEYSYVWGIFEYVEYQNYKLYLRRVEVLPNNQRSIWKEGLYTVGETAEMAPGLWKASTPPNWEDSCYWARINYDNGDIKANHFGTTGMTVRLYENEIFETNDNCPPWYYIGP